MSFKLDTGYFCKKRKAMNDNGKINRRDFIKSSVLTGGVLFAQAAIPARAMDFLSEKNKNENAMFTDDGLVKRSMRHPPALPPRFAGTLGR